MSDKLRVGFAEFSTNKIAEAGRHGGFAFCVWHALVSAGFAQGSTVFFCPRFALYRVAQDGTCLSRHLAKRLHHRALGHLFALEFGVIWFVTIGSITWSAWERTEVMILVY